MPRKTAAKDANGGKLGQYTTEVKKTIEKARLAGMEEQKKISKDFFLGEIDSIKKSCALRISHYEAKISSYKKNLRSSKWAVLIVGFVIGAALMGILSV